MSTNDTPTENGTVTAAALDARTDEHHHLGTDALGREHYVDQLLPAIWVVEDDTRVHVEDTADVTRWVRFIRTEGPGWDVLHHTTRSFAGFVCDAVEGR